MKNILLLDDDILIPKIIQLGLKKEGYNCLLFRTGHEALECIDSTDINLIITDLMMPEMDGLTFAASANQKKPDLPIIFLSSNAFNEKEDFVGKYYIKEYLTKPFEIDKILQVVKKHIL